MRGSTTLAVVLLAAGTALAQPAPQAMPPGPAPAPTPPPAEMNAPPAGATPQPAAPGGMAQRPRMSPKQRFEAANTTHDGRLTQQQALAAGWRMVANHFQEIDHDNKGYVTLQDLRDWHQARRAARAAARSGAAAPAGAAPDAAGAPAAQPPQ